MVSELISSDIVSILLLVSPGFVTIALIGKLSGITIYMEQFEKTTWSLIASVPIGILFFFTNGLNKIDNFLDYFISHPFLSLFEIGLFCFILAVFISLILRYKILEIISKNIIYTNESSVLTDHSVWDGFMFKNFKRPVIVRTLDSEYKGWLSASSTRDEKREVVIDQPVIIYTDKDGNTQDFPLGRQIILFGEDIKSITILEENDNAPGL